MEGVRRARAVRGGIGERADELQLLDDRARPAVADDQRERVLVLGADVDEVDVEPVDLGDEVREGVQPRLALAPVVLGRPVAGEVLHDREGHALRVVLDGLLLGEARRGDARPQVLEIRLGDLDRERADRGVARWAFGRDSHVVLLGGDGGVVTGRSLLVSSARRPRRARWVAYGVARWGARWRLRVIAWERYGRPDPSQAVISSDPELDSTLRQLPARVDPELHERVAQMPLHGARAEEEPGADVRTR